MNRREFAATTGALSLVAVMPACWMSNIYKTISSYVPVALLAFDRVISILVEHGVDTTRLTEAVNRVKAALADILTAVVEYHDAAEQAKETMIHAIAVALKIACERLVEFWELLKIPNEQLARTIKMLIDIMVSTLTGFIGQLAPGTPVAGQRFVSAPRVRTLKEFREDFNAVLRERDEGQFAI